MLGVCFLFLGAYLLMSKPSSPQPKPTEEQPKAFTFGCYPQSKPVEVQPMVTIGCSPQSKPVEVQPKSFFGACSPQSKPIEEQPKSFFGASRKTLKRLKLPRLPTLPSQLQPMPKVTEVGSESDSDSEPTLKRPKGSQKVTTTTDKFRDTCHKATELLFSFLELNQAVELGGVENKMVRRKEKVLLTTMTSISEELARLKTTVRKTK